MPMTLAVLGGIGVFGLMAVAITALLRRAFWVRQLAFPLYVAAGVLALEVYLLIAPAAGAALPGLRPAALLFLGLVTVLRLVALYLFDVHLAAKGLRLPPLIPTVTMFVVYFVTGILTLRLAFPKLDVAPLIATSAVTSLVLGLALQPILGNFFAGLVLSVERPFRINDWIKVGEAEGRVVAVTWRTTHLRTRENDNLVIPNSKLADERVLNYYYPQPIHMERLKIPIHYSAPPYQVRRILIDCATGVPGVLDKPAVEVYLLSFDASHITYELRPWVEDVVAAPRIGSEIRQRVWEELKKQGIVIPYPIQTIEIAPRQRPSTPKTGGAPDARLYVAEGPDRGKTLVLDPATPALVGRSRACGLALGEPNASKEHLRIAWEGGEWILTDLDSSFGSRVNGAAGSRVILHPFDRITIGETTIIFEPHAH